MNISIKAEIDNSDEFKNKLIKEIKVVIKDIINNTTNCDVKYHSWLSINRNRIVPRTFLKNYYYDIQISPYRYVNHMIYMCLELEKIEKKSFQFFPLQSSGIPRHIQVDTKSLCELFIETGKHQEKLDIWIKTTINKNGEVNNKTKKDLYFCLEENKEFIWDTFFNIKQKIKNYIFDYTIITDGFSTSLRFLHKDMVEEEKNKKRKMKEGRRLAQSLTEEEKTEKKNSDQINKKQRLLNSVNNKKSKKQEKQDNPEFAYIDDVPKSTFEGKKCIFIDPGKRTLLSMMDDNGNFLSYSNKEYLKSTKRIKYQNLIKNFRNKLGITSIEESLSEANSKSCSIEKFTKYIELKSKANETVVPLYQHTKFRQYRFYSYLNTKRTQDNMVNKIVKKYSKDHIIIIGDWSIGKQMRNYISTPNLTLKRKLNEKFSVYNIDEYRTSILSNVTEERCSNLTLKFKKDRHQKKRLIRSILTYKMVNNRIGCINRDKNGCKNMQKIFKSYMETGERPERYRRGYNF